MGRPCCVSEFAKEALDSVKIAYLVRSRPDLADLNPADVEYTVQHADEHGVWSPEALDAVADVEAFVIGMEPVNPQILAAAPKLRIAQRMGVGYETLDLQACAERGVYCCNLVGVNKEAVAEHGMTLILALARRLLEMDTHTRNDNWEQARLLTAATRELHGKTLGIFGLGNTGAELAVRARALGLRVLYHEIRPIAPEVLERTAAHFVSKEELLRSSDIVSVNTNLNDTSRNMIDAQALAQMQPGALLVCCARGGVVDEEALADALNSGHLGGAGVDVFDPEPVRSDNPLLKAKNCLVTAHVAGVTDETTRRIYDWAMENVRRVVQQGKKPQWILNGL